MQKRSSSMYDVRDIWAIAWKRKWMIFIPLVIVASATFGLSYLIEPEYEASTIIAIHQDVPLTTELQRLIGTDDRVGRNNQRRDQLLSILNELTSTAYLSMLVERLHLDDDPSLDSKARNLLGNQPEAALQALKFSLLQGRLKDKIDISFAGQDQVMITTQSSDPGKARDIANTLGEIYITEKLKQELTSIRSSQDFSDFQLQKYEAQLQAKIDERTAVERRLLQIQLDESVTSESNRSQIVSEIDRSNQDVRDLRSEEKIVLATLAPIDGISANNLTLRESDEHKELKTELRGYVRNLGDQIGKYLWSDPQILNSKVRQNTALTALELANKTQVNQQYAQFNESVRNNLVRLFNIRSNLDHLYSKASYLTSALDELEAKMNRIPELQAQLNRLTEEIATATDLRDRFERQQESSTISQALLEDASSSKYKVVEPAKRPLEPFKPDRKQILLMGIALGLMIGCGAAVVTELLDNSLKKVEEVEEFIGLPVLGIAPKADFMKKMAG